MATPLTLLLTKDHFEWTSAAQLAFENLKIAISIAPVLSLPNFCLPIVLETDASDTGMGAVLSQQGHLIAFFNKSFGLKLLNDSIKNFGLTIGLQVVRRTYAQFCST